MCLHKVGMDPVAPRRPPAVVVRHNAEHFSYLKVAALALTADFFSGASSHTILETVLARWACCGPVALTCGPRRKEREPSV